MVGPLSSWKSVKAKSTLPLTTLCVSSHASSPATTEREAVVAKKVRVHPQDESQWDNLCGLHRCAYNAAIAAINNGKPNQVELRAAIREDLRARWESYGATFVSTVCDEAVNLAFDTLRKCAKRWKKGEKAKLKFRSRRDASQGFFVQKAAIGGQLLPKVLGKTYLAEKLEFDVSGQMARITRMRGRYFVSFRHKLTLSENQTGNRVVAVDPGVRTFATTFSFSEVCKYGEGLHQKLLDLSHKIDGLKSVFDKLPKGLQWADQRRKNLQRKMWRLANRIHDLVHDLHKRVAYDLVASYDVILLPTFETSQMMAKEGRKIRKGTTRSMATLAFHRFSLHLEWMCRKYGKTLVRVNESYTSKTDSRTGEVKQIGGAKTINGLDRDINGARGILLRALSRATAAQITSKSDSHLSLLPVLT